MLRYFISHTKPKDILPSITLDFLQTSILIYNYGEQFKSKENQTIKSFVENNNINNIEISDNHKEILLDIKKNKPLSYVSKFIDNPISCIQVAVTVCEEQERISVIFRGSESLIDWYYNFNFFKHNLKDNIWVHSGFFNQLFSNNTYQDLIREIEDLNKKFPNFSIYVSGHSLGGALSTLFGYLLSHEIDKNITIFSFASPRVGNYNWKESFESKHNLIHYRITNDYDIVSAIPNINYYHVGNNIRLLENSIVTKKKKKYYWYQIDFWIDYYYESILRCWSIAEHNCETYYSRIKKYIE